MASRPKPSSARALGHTPKYAWAVRPTTGLADCKTWPASTRGRRGALGPERAQSVCCGMAHGDLLVAKPRQDVHRRLPQSMVHSPDMIESPS
jgi:hypothetical protein